ncbi:MAG: non-canonical purine NTP pyrophosphatase [Deltaproteobacteria bacterium]|nr:non-canonical purine NTP pyrophosphatase [Deltaproteobacteria bacterium]
MKTLLLATANPGKRSELQELCRDVLGADSYAVKTLKDVGLGDVDVVEDAPDFIGNARKKAREIAALVRERDIPGVDVVVADDSGLVVDALDGHPGVRSHRFSADAGYAPPGLTVDEANNRLMLLMLAPVPAERRTARFVSFVIAQMMSNDAVELHADGAVEGLIARDLLGSGGFGFDPLFIVNDGPPELRGRRLAELTSSEKHSISHRGRAMRALLAQLKP